MSEINWDDNARTAVSEFATWAKLVDNGLLGEFMKTIATRPQTKTVADAYEYLNDTSNGEWDSDWDYLNFDYTRGWYYSDEGLFATLVCTREQFEAYAKEQDAKQEGEKWTHYYMGNEYCKIVVETPDKFGLVVVDCEDNGYVICETSDLKPIKPKLTVKEYELMARMASFFHVRDSEFDEYMSKFDSELI